MKGPLALLVSLLAVLFALPAVAADLTREISFNIPQQPLAQALAEFSRQSDVIIVASSDLTAGKISKPINATTTAAKALTQLLDGSQLVYTQDKDGSIVVQKPTGITMREADPPHAPLASSDSSDSSDQPQAEQTIAESSNKNSQNKPVLEEVAEEVVVTGTRIRKSGMTTPTPVTVTSAEQLQVSAPASVADALNQLPQFNFASRTTNPNTAVNNGPGAGQNILSLYGLGGNRTLVLIDGRRLPASNTEGSVDINTIPVGLLERVDTVTGGASAAYGSDAVAGVVNFVLDKRFNGIKGEISGGVSTYGDMPLVKASIVGGSSLFDDRLHVIGGIDLFRQGGVRADQKSGRDWYDVAAGLVPNPVTGVLPKNVIISDLRSAIGTYGGLITSGPLAGTEFLPGGATQAHDYGLVRSGNYQSGGDGARQNIGLAPDQHRWSALTHAEFAVNDELTPFAEAAYAYSHTLLGAFVDPHTGSANQFTISNDNAYLPASVLAAMNADHITSFVMGRYDADFPLVQIEDTTKAARALVGVKGNLGSGWKYDASYSYAQTNLDLRENNVANIRHLYAAADAVTDPATGKIVCHSTLAGLDPGCVPLNLFGQGSPSKAAIDYVIGDSVKYVKLNQDFAEINLSGDLDERFSFGAGPISVAMGAEYRKESVEQTTDPLSPLVTSTAGLRGAPAAKNNFPGTFNFFNPTALAGSYDIKEAYVETSVPILKDLSFAKSLTIDAAARHAKYSTSGGATTWKLGGNYAVNDAIRFRVSRSLDIRAPNTLELFNAATQSNLVTIYNGVSYQTLGIASGNPHLRPENSNNLTYGVVFNPSFIRGLQVSIDKYQFDITDVISTYGQQQTIDQCALGNQLACSLFTHDDLNKTILMYLPTLNLNKQVESGVDIEVDYRTHLGDGNLSIRLLGNNLQKDYTISVGNVVNQIRGISFSPKWRANAQLNYSTDKFRLFVQERMLGAGMLDPNKIEGVDFGLNHVPNVFYTDATLGYKFDLLGSKQELYLAVNNLFNRSPPVSPYLPSSFNRPQSDAYDTVGRYVMAGVRFNY
jgi:iron complex outermembrane receptor protein